MPLEDYKDIVATAASVTTIGQCFSPVFICKDIISRQTTKDVEVTPFLGGMSISVLMLQHGFILQDPAMIPVNVFAFSLNFIYFAIYYFYSNDKSALLARLGKAAVFVATLLGYAQWEATNLVEFRFGLIVTLLMLGLIASPLLSLGEIMRTKSTRTLPFPLIVSGSVVTFLWLLYGIIINNIFIQVQNLVGFVLSLAQLSLFAIFPSIPTTNVPKKNQ